MNNTVLELLCLHALHATIELLELLNRSGRDPCLPRNLAHLKLD